MNKKKFHPRDFKVELVESKKPKLWMHSIVNSKTVARSYFIDVLLLVVLVIFVIILISLCQPVQN